MSKGKFTAQADLLWRGIPPVFQKQILKTAICAKCNVLVEIVDYSGTVKNDDLILDGSCVTCGHAAARIVEMSQTRPEDNHR